MTSAMKCISWLDKQTESLGSMVPVVRLRGGASKKLRRRDEQLKQNKNHNNQSDNKSKRIELSSDDEIDNNCRTKKPTANVTKTVDFDSHVYSNNAVMVSNHDVNYQLLDKFKSYFSDRTRDGGASNYMGLSQLDLSLSAKLGGTSKFTSRRDYQEAMAPRGTNAHTSDSESDSQTRPPVLRL